MLTSTCTRTVTSASQELGRFVCEKDQSLRRLNRRRQCHLAEGRDERALDIEEVEEERDPRSFRPGLRATKEQIGQDSFADVIEEPFVVRDLPVRPWPVWHSLGELAEIGNVVAALNDQLDEEARWRAGHRMDANHIDRRVGSHERIVPGNRASRTEVAHR
jgi:hypothetical protein